MKLVDVEMVKFRERKIKRRYKRKERLYKRYLMEFPAKANPEIEPHKNKNFDGFAITSKDTSKQEFLSINLVRNKTAEEYCKQQPE